MAFACAGSAGGAVLSTDGLLSGDLLCISVRITDGSGADAIWLIMFRVTYAKFSIFTVTAIFCKIAL